MSGPLNDSYQSMAANAICHEAHLAGQVWQAAAAAHERPSVLFRPSIFRDGDGQWCALLGPDMLTGVVGLGNTPDAAMRAFDRAWYRETGSEQEVAP